MKQYGNFLDETHGHKRLGRSGLSICASCLSIQIQHITVIVAEEYSKQ